MALPNSINPSTPTGSSARSLGDDQLRALKQAIIDIFGLPPVDSITSACISVNTSGTITAMSLSVALASTIALEAGVWTEVTGSRAIASVYQNTSGRKRRASGAILGAAADEAGVLFWASSVNPPGFELSGTAINTVSGAGISHQIAFYGEVPNNWYYKITRVIGTETLYKWFELDE